VDRPGGNQVDRAGQTTVRLDPAETRALLQQVPAASGAHADEVLVAALARALAGWTGATRVGLWMEGHGRETLRDEVDVARTVGWLTALFPVALEVDPRRPAADTVRSVREQLRRVPRGGVDYGVLRYLGGPAVRRRLAAAPGPEVVFNYLGRFDQSFARSGLFALAGESEGGSTAPRGERMHAIEVGALVVNDALRVHWVYPGDRYRAHTIERVAAAFLAGVRETLEVCAALERSAEGVVMER
jgi:non-ribosomal peptide synthase protein (TIGR01720 family)